jgi:hypothetical protein
MADANLVHVKHNVSAVRDHQPRLPAFHRGRALGLRVREGSVNAVCIGSGTTPKHTAHTHTHTHTHTYIHTHNIHTHTHTHTHTNRHTHTHTHTHTHLVQVNVVLELLEELLKVDHNTVADELHAVKGGDGGV